jgi:hypothetical protein
MKEAATGRTEGSQLMEAGSSYFLISQSIEDRI